MSRSSSRRSSAEKASPSPRGSDALPADAPTGQGTADAAPARAHTSERRDSDVDGERRRLTNESLRTTLLESRPDIPEEIPAKPKHKSKTKKQAMVDPARQWRQPSPQPHSASRLYESPAELSGRAPRDVSSESVGLANHYLDPTEDVPERKRPDAKKSPLQLPSRSLYGPNAESSASLSRLMQRALKPRQNPLFPMFPGRRCIAVSRGTRIELHAHLEGSVRHETIWEFMKAKNLSLPGDGSLRALKEALIVQEPMSLSQFLEPVPFYLRAFAGDVSALERIAYEFCEDKVQQGVLYVEAHYAPQMLTSHKYPRARTLQELGEVVMAINRGFRLAEIEMGIIVRTVLSIVIGMGDCNDIIHLVQKFYDEGVVGIDLHSSYQNVHDINSDVWTPAYEEVPLTREELKAFNTASSLGIHRTVHAGLNGSAYMIQRGIDKYRAQRIGHGYEVLKLPQVYTKCRERNVHFECCPWMSLLAGAVDAGTKKHPVAQFAEDGANFSLSTSYPTITGLTLQEEYDLVTSWGLTEAHLVRSNINALRSSFLQSADKTHLMQTLLENIGIKKRSAEQ